MCSRQAICHADAGGHCAEPPVALNTYMRSQPRTHARAPRPRKLQIEWRCVKLKASTVSVSMNTLRERVVAEELGEVTGSVSKSEAKQTGILCRDKLRAGQG